MSKANQKSYDFVFFSPHLDDAILSAAGLIERLVKKKTVLLVTIFTEADKKQLTNSLAQDKFLTDSKQKDPDKLFSLRKKEDQHVAKKIGVDILHLGFKDVLFRKNNHQLIYTDFNQVFSGKINKNDNELIELITKSISKVINELCDKKTKFYTCLGIGNHIDHLMLFNIIRKLSQTKKVWFWGDIPYKNFIGKTEDRISAINKSLKIEYVSLNKSEAAKKEKICKLYQSQYQALRENGLGDLDFTKECFYQII